MGASHIVKQVYLGNGITIAIDCNYFHQVKDGNCFQQFAQFTLEFDIEKKHFTHSRNSIKCFNLDGKKYDFGKQKKTFSWDRSEEVSKVNVVAILEAKDVKSFAGANCMADNNRS